MRGDPPEAEPCGVLTIRLIDPSAISSMVVGSPAGPMPSKCLRTTVAGIPLRRSTSAVPWVASTSKPRSASRLIGKIIVRLSRLAIETNTRPEVGSEPYAAVCDLANAVPNIASKPITSPVERISGPEHGVDGLAVGRLEPVERHHRLLDRDRRVRRQVAAVARRRPAPRPRAATRSTPPASPGPRPWPAAPPSPWTRTARCATPAGWPRARRARRSRARTGC